jgi:hypothetical protein
MEHRNHELRYCSELLQEYYRLILARHTISKDSQIMADIKLSLVHRSQNGLRNTCHGLTAIDNGRYSLSQLAWELGQRQSTVTSLTQVIPIPRMRNELSPGCERSRIVEITPLVWCHHTASEGSCNRCHGLHVGT